MGLFQISGEKLELTYVYRSEPTSSRKLRFPDDYLFDQIHCEHSGGQLLHSVDITDSVGKLLNSADSVNRFSK